MLCRCVRHYFQNYIQNVEVFYTGAAIAHFLNCLLGSVLTGNQQIDTQTNEFINPLSETTNLISNAKKSNKKKRNKIISGNNISNSATTISTTKGTNLEWKKLSIKSLWKVLIEDSKQHYNFEILAENSDQFLQWSGTNRTSILRRVCNLLGIQLVLKVLLFI